MVEGAAGHHVAGRAIVKDDAPLVRNTVERQLAHADIDAIMYDMNAFAEENMRFPLDVDLLFSGGEGI